MKEQMFMVVHHGNPLPSLSPSFIHGCACIKMQIIYNSPCLPACLTQQLPIQGAPVNWTILQHCFFWFSNTGADAATAILLPTSKRFSCNGAVDCSTCFCCESVLQNGDSFVIAQREFQSAKKSGRN